jgi:hypothetical protein
MNLDESNLVKLVCVLENTLISISKTTGLPLTQLRIGPLAAPLHLCYYLLSCNALSFKQTIIHSLQLYSELLFVFINQFILLLVGFDTLTYRKGYDRSPTLVGYQPRTV